MKNSTQYLLIAGGLVTGLVGGITLGVSQADDIDSAKRLPGEIMHKVAGKDNSKPVIPIQQIISRYEKAGSRITDIELDREMFRDVYELELVDADGDGG